MPITPTYPGVYVQEVPSGVRTIAGVSTSIALFIGMTKKGPLNQPIRCPNYTEFVRNFSEDASIGDLPRAVKLFFTNGGTDCYVMRIAQGVGYSVVTLKAEDETPTLDLTAKSPGSEGEWIRTSVTYNGLQPESTFNITIFSWVFDAGGNKSAQAVETFTSLSMNPNSSRYAPTFITQNSKLVDAALSTDLSAPSPTNGYSISGRPVPYDSLTDEAFRSAWDALIGSNGAGKKFQISVDGSGYVTVDLSTIDVNAMDADNVETRTSDLPEAIKTAIEDAYKDAGITGVTVTVSFEDGPEPLNAFGTSNMTSLLKIQSDSQGDVLIKTDSSDDAALPLMLGTENGGIEVSAHSPLRPAPNGVVFKANDLSEWNALGTLEQQTIQNIQLDEVDATTGAPTVATFEITGLQTTSGTDPFWVDGYTSNANGNSDGIREKLAVMRDAINARAVSNNKTFHYKAELWGHRLAVVPTSGDDNFIPDDFALMDTNGTIIVSDSSFVLNTYYSSVGASGANTGFQASAATVASDGSAPGLADYDNAYLIVDDKVDLFNLMILPPSADASAPAQTDLWGAASVFCYNRRAFLLMDPPNDWDGAQTAADGADALRVGLTKDYAAVFYPRVTINENGLKLDVGPSGAIAGLMARIDSSRGVWKAPAGTEADLRGVVGLEYVFSDAQNGFMNPRGINTIRVFPNGIVNWGARTMDGDNDFGSEYKYIPVRRLALFMEESLYRGLKWVVFEPNDAPLWAQIRLNVGAFMHGLFRQGAFQGQKPTDAYFVKCDAETTTQNDINLGIVNIIVGFAPLKPAEFVILSIQQIAGQIET